MKKTILCLAMAVIMLVAMVPISAADYQAADYSIPFDKIYGGDGDATISTTTFDGKNVVSVKKSATGTGGCYVTIGENPANGGWGSATAGENKLDVRFGDYKYLVVKGYWELDTAPLGSTHNIQMQIKQVSHNGTTASPWTGYKAQTNAMGAELTQFGPLEDYWCYMIFVLGTPSYTDNLTDTAKWPGGKDSKIEFLQFYPFTNGAFKNSDMSDTDAFYMQFLTFTNDYEALIAADMAADDAGDDNNDDNNTNDGNTNSGNTNDGTNGGNNTETEPAETETETNAPETTAAPETTETAEEKGGCGSAIGFAIVPVALTAGGVCVMRRKKKDD